MLGCHLSSSCLRASQSSTDAVAGDWRIIGDAVAGDWLTIGDAVAGDWLAIGEQLNYTGD